MHQHTRAARPLASAIGVALSLTLLAPAGLSSATAATVSAQAPVVAQGPTAQAATAFTDVLPGHDFYNEISWMAANGISNGWTLKDGTKVYRPNERVLRDQMAAFMYRLAGSPEYTPPATSKFSDVRPGQVFYKEISWLADQGVSNGWAQADGTRIFGPGRPVLRDQMAAFMYRLDDGGHLESKVPVESIEPLFLSDASLPPAEVGTRVQWALTASGGTKPYTFQVISGILPQGLSLDANAGVISGTPSSDYESAVTIKLSDARGRSTTAALALIVRERHDENPLRMATGAVNVEVGEKATQQLVAGGTAPYTLERTAGNIPDGLGFNSQNGTIVGVGTHRTDNDVSFKITDAAGRTITARVPFSVAKRDIAVVRPDGTVWEWTADPKHPAMHAPKQREGIHDAKQVAVAYEGTYVLRADGTVWGWGSNYWTPLGNPDVQKYTGAPVRIGELGQVTQIGATSQTMFAVRASNWIYGWGVNRDYLLSSGASINAKVEQPLNLRDPWSNSHIETGANSVYAMGPHNGVVAWGKNDCNQLGDRGWDPMYPAPYSSRTVISGFSNVKSMAAGNCTFYGQKTDGSVWAWGHNTGEVPATGGLRPHRTTPGLFTDITDVKQLDVGGRAVYALKSNGTVWAWGRSHNNGSDLGTTRTTENYPVQLKGLTNITKVWAEEGRGFALAADGTMWGWGQLGTHLVPHAPNGMTSTPVKLTF